MASSKEVLSQQAGELVKQGRERNKQLGEVLDNLWGIAGRILAFGRDPRTGNALVGQFESGHLQLRELNLNLEAFPRELIELLDKSRLGAIEIGTGVTVEDGDLPDELATQIFPEPSKISSRGHYSFTFEDQQIIGLSPSEFMIVQKLSTLQEGEEISRSELAKSARPDESDVDRAKQLLSADISKLNEKLRNIGAIIHNSVNHSGRRRGVEARYSLIRTNETQSERVETSSVQTDPITSREEVIASVLEEGTIPTTSVVITDGARQLSEELTPTPESEIENPYRFTIEDTIVLGAILRAPGLENKWRLVGVIIDDQARRRIINPIISKLANKEGIDVNREFIIERLPSVLEKISHFTRAREGAYDKNDEETQKLLLLILNIADLNEDRIKELLSAIRSAYPTLTPSPLGVSS